jgi:hypothetical protein
MEDAAPLIITLIVLSLFVNAYLFAQLMGYKLLMLTGWGMRKDYYSDETRVVFTHPDCKKQFTFQQAVDRQKLIEKYETLAVEVPEDE